jgi:hypothetical protein
VSWLRRWWISLQLWHLEGRRQHLKRTVLILVQSLEVAEQEGRVMNVAIRRLRSQQKNEMPPSALPSWSGSPPTPRSSGTTKRTGSLH